MKKQDKYLIAGIAGIAGAVLLAKNPQIVSGIFGSDRRSKTAFDSSAVRSVKATALLIDGKNAGRIVSAYGSGGGCTTTIHIWSGPFSTNGNEKLKTTFRAGGYGYDKEASNLEAFSRQFPGKIQQVRSFGSSGVDAFREYGYEVINVIS